MRLLLYLVGILVVGVFFMTSTGCSEEFRPMIENQDSVEILNKQTNEVVREYVDVLYVLDDSG